MFLFPPFTLLLQHETVLFLFILPLLCGNSWIPVTAPSTAAVVTGVRLMAHGALTDTTEIFFLSTA